ncbi:DsbA family protein [bacterium]|nr:MAG: DsbA family protein [bacterium]
MDHQNNIDIEKLSEDKQKIKGRFSPIIVTIIIAAWLIGVSILGAGWLISREIREQGSVNKDSGSQINTDQTPVQIDIPRYKSQLGSDDAKVTVIEFADFQCPFCGEWHKTIFPKMESEYIQTGKVKFIYWDLAFLGDESIKAAEAAVCAKDQGKFWEYHDRLFDGQFGENQGAFSDDNLKKIALELGVDSVIFNKCFDTRLYKDLIEESNNLSQKYGVNSTPTVFINGIRTEGVMPYENYKQIIDSELAK